MKKEPPVGQRGRTGGAKIEERASCGSKESAQEEIDMEKEPPVGQKARTGGDKHKERTSCGSKSPHRRR